MMMLTGIPLSAQYQANNAYFGDPAKDIRDASLRNRADEAQKFVWEAHSAMDELENALLGPEPRNGAASAEARPTGLRHTIDDTATQAAMLVVRLRTLMDRL